MFHNCSPLHSLAVMHDSTWCSIKLCILYHLKPEWSIHAAQIQWQPIHKANILNEKHCFQDGLRIMFQKRCIMDWNCMCLNVCEHHWLMQKPCKHIARTTNLFFSSLARTSSLSLMPWGTNASIIPQTENDDNVLKDDKRLHVVHHIPSNKPT